MKHDWILDVLADLKAFSQHNDLPELAQAFGLTEQIAQSEIEAKEMAEITRVCPELCVSGPAHAVRDTQASKRSPNIMAN